MMVRRRRALTFAPLALAVALGASGLTSVAAPSGRPRRLPKFTGAPAHAPTSAAASAGALGAPSAAQALNAADFGAVGSCHHNATTPIWSACRDMAPALQRAIDAAQRQRKALFIPAGRYALNTSLLVRSNQNQSELLPSPDGED